ncbi:MAG TPA: 3'-5' exonuclease, partial [Candidatus Saccharibacteria bacterium]|nr:3'-5' exonuclease [Candidatus Saccharibacteria bacterium]
MYDDAEEAQLVADRISSQAAIGARQYDDFAVLYRTNAQSAMLERALLQRRIPYQIIGGVRFYDRKEIKDIVAYLRLLYQPNDRMSFSRIVNIPARGIGAVSLEKFLTWQSASGKDIISALSTADMVVTGKAKQGMLRLAQLLQSLRGQVDSTAPADLIEEIIKATHYDDYLQDGTPQAEDREGNIGALISDARTYTTLSDFLEEVALMSSADNDQQAETVTLMTLHAAKGLEFPVVFMVGLEEGILPHARVFEGPPSELEEERRLCYVGMTRAREELHIS